MSYQTLARNYAKEIGNQTRKPQTIRVSHDLVAALHPTQKNVERESSYSYYKSRGSKSREHRVSNDAELN